MKNTKKSLMTSVVALLLCFSMLLGATYAWFTDVATSNSNVVQTGNLDAEMYWSDTLLAADSDAWQNAEGVPIFTYDNWEPGYTDVKYVKVKNAGNLAFQWRLSIEAQGSVTDLADVIDVYYINPVSEAVTTLSDKTTVGVLSNVIDTNKYTNGVLLPATEVSTEYAVGETILAIALHMHEDAGNHYKGKSIGDGFSVRLIATQFNYEEDSFDNKYDEAPEWPGNVTVGGNSASATVEPTSDYKVSSAVSLLSSNGVISAEVPAGVMLDPNVTKLTLNVSDVANSQANVTLSETEASLSIDVHIDGVAADNDVVMAIGIKELLPVGLNMGNYRFYHVENGQTGAMTLLADGAVAEHNNYEYDPATGDVVLYLKSFSEVAMIAEPAAWEGNRDYSWYTNAVAPVDGQTVTEYIIANADQLAALSAIVGGMAKDENGNFLITYTDSDGDEHHNDTFSGKTVKLVADINLGDKESENNPDIIFYPIGYNSDDGKYEKTGVAVSTGFYNFCGTFDGNGHTVSNFYQNTWEMKGDHNWYDATLQYYRDGMGLFGRVYGGTVKNLTVENFSSDGEITTTGTIAAYADGATFENISIFNCNPRVYNIGNGGIVGCVGWYAKDEGLKTTFTNITVDNSNKISALWGSYDVACGGIVGQYYPTSGQTSAGTPKNAGIDMKNCHVAAQMDVYNDVCANYQYYAYRYAGMLIGSVRENETIGGHVYPKMDGITASGCTVHFGTWNDYYYCEIIDNTTASYTHDYQMSRLVEIKAIDGTTITYLDDSIGTVPASGRANYVIVDYTKGHGTENATCYHFKDGAVWTHDMGGIQEGIDENGDGKDDLKEDKQHIYLEFNNLVTGYGWGVTSKGVNDLDGVEILDRAEGTSVEKFEVIKNAFTNNRVYKLGDIFSFVNNGVKLVPGALTVTITNLDENGNVSATVEYDRENWENSTISFKNTGNIKITIQDYYFCIPTELTVNITERQPEVKFDVVMNNGDFLHRVGNIGTVPIDKLFKSKDGVDVGTISVTVEAVDGTGASGTYSNNAIQFNGTGVVKATITDNDWCIPTVLYLEVVDAKNYSGKTGESLNATSNNVVLLCNIGSGFTVSGEYTFFGNGFTLNYTGNGQYLNNGLRQGLVTVSENGTLDNLRIKATIYPSAYLYYEEAQSGPSSVEGDKTRYHYQLSSVAASGNATISNCYIYGGRNNIFVNTGNVTITDTITECGTLANIQIQSTNASTVTLENVTTIQYRVNATIGDTSAVMLGAGIIVGPDTETNPTIVLNGSFKQYNWVTAEDKEKVTNSTAETIIDTALGAAAFNHTVNGVTASNLGIIYLNNVGASVTNNTGLPYEFADVSMMNQDGQVYSLQNATESQIYSDYANADKTTVNGDYIPRFDFDLGNQEISYDGSEDTRYMYGDKNGVTALYQDGYDPITLDLSKLATIYKYNGINYTVTAVCKDASGNILTANNGVVTLSALGSYTLVFTVNDNIFYDQNGQPITKNVERTYSVPLNLTVKAADIKNAIVSITKTALDGVYTTVNLTDYKLRINFLDAISVTDYDNKGTGTTVDLTSNISSATLTPASVNVFTTASTITVTYTDGRVLTVNLSKISGSSPGTKTAIVNTSGGLYFITDGALNDKPTEASSQNKCTITSVSFKGNSGSTITDDTDVTVTWELGSSSGTTPCVTPDTLITLADGTQVRVDSLTGSEMLLVWNHETGALESIPVAYIVDHDGIISEREIIHLNFSNGKTVKIIGEHVFFDATLNKYVAITAENADEFIGHVFVALSEDGTSLAKTELVSVEREIKETTVYEVVSYKHLTCFTEGILSTSAYLDPLLNVFDINGETFAYDMESVQKDIETYGLYTYADFENLISEEAFELYNAAYLKIAVGKGYIVYQDILDLIDIYFNVGVTPIEE